MKKLVIFGAGDIAELAHFYFTNDSEYEIVAFTVDAQYREGDHYKGKPLVDFKTIESRYSPNEHEIFIALSYSGLNDLRKDKYMAAKAKGYQLASYISSQASVFHHDNIGDNVFLLEDNTIQPFVKIGNNVTLWSGNHIGHHSVIEDHNFISSQVVVSGGVTIKQSSFIGVNATLRDHITIGSKNVIGAGSIIMTDTDDSAVYIADKTMPKKITSDKLKSI